ncbi:MAG: N-acetyltransferase [Proteobacteria bacterium]|nr:N-acetyltransferase [Pseudomonadota bacterium]
MTGGSFFVHPSSYIDDGVEIGAGTKIWFFNHVQSGTVIGERCIFGQNINVDRDVTIGNGVKVQNNVSIYKGVTVCNDAFLGPSCVFTNVLNPRAHVERKDEFRPTRVGVGATVGANATIVCGNNLGDYSMVGAGTVVTKDVPAYALVVGVPAKHLGWVSASGERLHFGDDGTAVCPGTGEGYVLKDGAVSRG